MVWFQCEDCGDNLKKPKLPNHFRMCSASKLSCIDCGQVFGQQTVEAHTKCISESEKYGPKGLGKTPNGTNTKTKNDAKQKPEVDINVGLSDMPPWFCSLCNTKATSKQTLLLHAEGKKHRAKARGFHASRQQLTDTVESKNLTETKLEVEVSENNVSQEPRDQNSFGVTSLHDGSAAVGNRSLQSKKKRKHDTPERDGAKQKMRCEISAELNGSAVNQVKGVETELTESCKKVEKHMAEDTISDSLKKKIKWKKLITASLKSNSDKVLKFKELRKLVLKSLGGDGFAVDKNQVSEKLEKKINSSTQFTIHGKYVSLVTSS